MEEMSGKTILVESLFGKILKLPTALVDITTYSETGYVGQDPSTILTRLLHTADENPMLASIGIVCLDDPAGRQVSDPRASSASCSRCSSLPRSSFRSTSRTARTPTTS